MPVPSQESRKSKMPSQKAEEAENELKKAEVEANTKAQEEVSKPEGEGGKETPKSDSAPDKETSPKTETTEQKPKAGQPAEEAEEDLEEEEVQQLSAKAQKRFRKMAQTIKDLKEKGQKKEVETPKTDVPIEEPIVDDLEDFSDVEEPEAPKVPEKETKPKKKLPWETDEEDKPDDDGNKVLTEKELEDKTRKISQEETYKTLRAEKEQKYNRAIVNRLSSDVKLIESTYDILNPKPDMTGTKETNKNYGKPTNPSYRQDIAKTLTETYKRLFKADKRVRLLTFIQQQMGLIEQGKKLGKEEVDLTVNKQNAEQPLTPSGGAPRKNNAIDAIGKATTLEELEATEALI